MDSSTSQIKKNRRVQNPNRVKLRGVIDTEQFFNDTAESEQVFFTTLRSQSKFFNDTVESQQVF